MPPFFRPVVPGVNRYDALLAAQIGHLPEAINVMEMYLKLVAQAKDAGQDRRPVGPGSAAAPSRGDSHATRLG